MKKTLIVFMPFIMVIISLSLIHVIVSNLLSTAGVDLDRIQTDLTNVEKQNILLREKVLSSESLSHIASAAAEMGFVTTKSNLYLPDDYPLAKR